jgi:hypothetical protein
MANGVVVKVRNIQQKGVLRLGLESYYHTFERLQ